MSLLRFIALLFSIAIAAAPASAFVVDHGSAAEATDSDGDDFADASADDAGDADDDDDDDDERGLWGGVALGHTLTECLLDGDEHLWVVAGAGQRLLRPPR